MSNLFGGYDMFVNLSEIIEQQREKLREFSNQQVTLTSDFKSKYLESMESGQIEFFETFAILTSSSDLHAYIPNQWFYLAFIGAPLTKAVVSYRNFIKEKSELSNSDFKDFILEAKTGNLDNNVFEKIARDLSDQEKNYLRNFLTDYSWWLGGKDLSRGDYFVSPVLGLLELINVSSSYVADISKLIADNFEIEDASFEASFVLHNEEVNNNIDNSENYDLRICDKYRQYIYFGAPGTGKSYQLNEDSKIFKEDNIERVTFHPNLTYGQFVGVFKPFPIEDDKITYRYIPGPFMNQLVQALLHPEEDYLLIVEEINRANVAAVFGDIFQLLDRDNNFKSIYPITISEDLKVYFENIVYKDVKNAPYLDHMKQQIQHGLVLPSNLFIWATMNSADQGVMPMDTAFKRRWEQKYFGINEAYEENITEFEGYKKIRIKDLDGSEKVIKWNDIRTFLNEQLTLLKVPEDKLLGPYFISKDILESTDEKLTESFKTKVLMYLFDDAAKQRRTELFNMDNNKMMYSEILRKFEKEGISVFKNYQILEEEIIPTEL